MKILTTDQIRAADEHTIESEPIASIDLMERASKAFTQWFVNNFSPKRSIAIICGRGNNGGDGLAIARLLLKRNYSVKVFIIGNKEGSQDFEINRKRLKDLTDIVALSSINDLDQVQNQEIIIDGIFGSGLSRPIEGYYKDVVEHINQLNCIRIAIDVPSGLFADKKSSGPLIRADHTLSFQVPKLALFLPENYKYVGDWTLLDIGLDKGFIHSQSSSNYYIDDQFIKPIIKERRKFDHKGSNGRGLIIAGSYGKIGAAVLCSKAALRSGIGLLTVNIPACGYDILQISAPEAMTLSDRDEKMITHIPEDINSFDCVGLGPGLGQSEKTVYALSRFFNKYNKPVVLDADALNIISGHRELLEVLPENSILTPHPGEFKRLVGEWQDDFEKLEKQKGLSKKYKIIIVLKGAFTSVSNPEGELFFNSTGNPGMATGGSGDVLTGILTGLMARKYTPQSVAVLGVYLHGLAGDLAADALGRESLKASDIIDFLPQAFLQLK